MSSGPDAPGFDNESGAQKATERDDDTDGRPDECDCVDWNTDVSLPCWPCYRVGIEIPATSDDATEPVADDQQGLGEVGEA